jgi:hypothetical protein
MRQLLLVVAVLVGLHHYWTGRAIDPGPGVMAPHEPVQHTLHTKRSFEHKGARLTPLADFELEARVLSKKRYAHDPAADLAPVDLALGWGPMSDSRVLDAIDISQRGRFYLWDTREPPIPIREIIRHSANMHIIPADRTVEDALDRIRPGHVVRLQGQLVKAQKDRWRIESSLTRADSGAGACEVVFVTHLEVSDPRTRHAVARR